MSQAIYCTHHRAIHLVECQMMKDARSQPRDQATGQYAWSGDMARMCVCGHTLGVHCAGGFDCLVGTNCLHDPHPGTFCDCKKFRLSRKRTRIRGD